jgi:hypothetical protein
MRVIGRGGHQRHHLQRLFKAHYNTGRIRQLPTVVLGHTVDASPSNVQVADRRSYEAPPARA